MTDDVLVVGAGPVGLTTACQLARLGVAVRVVDRLGEPTTESRAVGVHPRSLEMLVSLGVLPRLEARGRRIGGLEMLDGTSGRTRARMDFDQVPSRHPCMLDIAQPDTEAVLAERAAELGVVVERGVELTALAQGDDGVEVTLRAAGGEQRRRVGWVVGADGGHSTTRQLVGTQLEGGFHGQHFAMADVEVDTDLSPDTIRMFTHDEGIAMLFPLAGRRARTIFLVDPPPAGVEAPTLAEVQALADVRMGGRVRMRDPLWLTYFEVHHAQVPRYRHGRVFLAGDAAHIHSPAGAQGMNTGIQDAANLAWKLATVARGGADARLLDTYHDERHPVGADVVRTTTVLTAVGTATGAEAAVRNLALYLVGHVRRVADAVAAKTTEVTVSYRDSVLSVQHAPHHHGAAQAGDHAPDPFGLTRSDGTTVAVEDLATAPGFLALVRCDDPARVDELRHGLGDLGTLVELAESDGLLRRHYGFGSEGIALVRPDGYLGLVDDTVAPEHLRRYLTETLHLATPATT
ncbi:FAD-dependent monooxygenase [Actinomycetospora termitidis]|uniref:FAD-dependent monooxygenase n=1 Tax=Actinomycetospora termitidis TaxID=3053470 RepID=A0ABT7MCD4_9PSEU|nr:FAD-dependent monooxygenase [Actinomycetospora sp. Odt1-22]MDL5158326.1 FAD-dependent monooxygenase [Actinomycetospora sp. Odt1-22]